MSKTFASLLVLAALCAPVAAATKPDVVLLKKRYPEKLSYDGSAQLLSAGDGELNDSVMGLIDALKLRFPWHELWALRSANGLTLRQGRTEAALPLPEGSYFTTSYMAMSRDGLTLAFGTGRDGKLEAVRWRRGGALETLVPAGQAWLSGVTDISADGRTVIGWLLSDEKAMLRGFQWVEGKGFSLLPEPMSLPLALSADGGVTAGLALRGNLDMLRRMRRMQDFMNESPLMSDDEVTKLQVSGIHLGRGDVAGYFKHADTGVWHGFVWNSDEGKPRQREPLPWPASAEGKAGDAQVLAWAGMSGEDANIFTESDAVRWRAGEGVSVIRAKSVLEGLSADGRTVFVSFDREGDHRRAFVQVSPEGEADLEAVVRAETRKESLGMFLRSVSEDGRYLWLNSFTADGTFPLRLENGKLAPFSPVIGDLTLTAFSQDGRVVAGTSTQPEQGGYATLRWRFGAPKTQRLFCPGEERSSSHIVMSGDGKVVAAGQEKHGKVHTCLFGPLD
ncbi:hypothetical protein [Chromobacterium haemolyticum]|uniref:Uncharacterized protein n=1 Tax=Chromobacterium haemolyticum TaxID=394935 RepID=A0A1W0D3X8_9NEIS|nr:hypothetical protein [Chromobacterium haemolyticum]OQS41696.1 hypothetical protein B0T45_08160 [Chromobacterium haemolyticum]